MRFARLDAVLLGALPVAICGCYESHALLADADPDRASRDDGRDEAVADGDECIPVDDRCADHELCGNGSDDDCDGEVDEGCPCESGSVQSCFAGPPGRRGVGACTDGEQVCRLDGRWGPCEGGIVPGADVCNALDNLCTGCSERGECEIDCPGPGDPRVPEAAPLTDYPLFGSAFYAGPVRSWQWEVEGGPCDDRTTRFTSFELLAPSAETATFRPRLSGDYSVTLTVVTDEGETLACDWIVHVRGPGLRLELCYPECETEDLDLFVKQPGAYTPWYPDAVSAEFPSVDQCGWHNCKAVTEYDFPRVDWGYAPSDLSACADGPLGSAWRDLGYCANPRLDVDNNLREGIGLPENINIDVPRDGERFRIMVENYRGGWAHPLVNVYCDGRRVATFGAPPDEVPDFAGAAMPNVGAIWRVADVTTRVAADGATSCEVEALHPAGATRGYDVTYGELRY